jgi:uncharacterized membrane protein
VTSIFRRRYLDWLRGVAVVIMIEAHTLDAWTRPADRQSDAFGWAVIIGGFGAPLFLFLAGVAVALSASAKVARGAGPAEASAAVQRRGWQIFGLAFLFRLQAVLLGGGRWRNLLRVDVLNIMGPSIAAAAYVWRVGAAYRLPVFVLLTVGIAMVTPIIRGTSILDPLPAPVEAYLRPQPDLTTFTFFPWAAFVFAGVATGLLLERASDRTEGQLMARLFAGGAGIALAGYAASFLPPIYDNSSFWTSSPTFFFLRTGLLTMMVAGAYWWEQGPAGRMWSPLAQLGRTSLFIYWIHIELVYGVLARSIRRELPLGRAVAGFLLFTIAMLVVSIAKTRIAGWWRGLRAPMKEAV